MSDFDRFSRVNKFEKRRKNTKLMSILIVAASFLIIVLLGLWIFGPDDEPSVDDTTANPDQNVDSNQEGSNEEMETDEPDSDQESIEENSTESEETNSEQGEENNSNPETNENENIATQDTEPVAIDDENVISAYTADWQPIGTEQEGPHTIVYEEGSQDRIEMEQALRLATGLTEDDMITWWLKRGGDQQVIGTVSNRAETETYRVYISWVDNQGWQPTIVEILQENDEKWRFE